jgi:hypothetical protein
LDNLKLFKLFTDALGKVGNGQGDGKSSFDFSNLLQKLGGFTQKETQNQQENVKNEQTADNVKKAEKPVTSPPLQAGMLGTMKSHDEFIKRVKEKNKKY